MVGLRISENRIWTYFTEGREGRIRRQEDQRDFRELENRRYLNLKKPPGLGFVFISEDEW
jgi:hypothetical protein